MDQMNTHATYLDPILARHKHEVHDLLQILRQAQEHFGYIQPETIDYLSEVLQIPRAKIEGVASFTPCFI